jgi:hypothetical protein
VLFSELFKIKRLSGESWFDPFLTRDTALFIDPYLLQFSKAPEMKAARLEMMSFFQIVFEKIAETRTKEAPGKLMLDALRFPEVREICLGHTKIGTRGAGISKHFGTVFYETFSEYLAIGLDSDDMKHVEVLGLFSEGIGPDRISDITANVIKQHLIKYTQRICKEKGISVQTVRVERSKFDKKTFSWQPVSVELPVNPETGRAIILCPFDILRKIPSIDVGGFAEFLSDAGEVELIKERLGIDVLTNLNKRTLRDIIKSNPAFVKSFISKIKKYADAAPYDYERDPQLLYRLYNYQKLLSEVPIMQMSFVRDDADFSVFVRNVCEYFKEFMENTNVVDLLWVGDKPRSEGYAQKLFFMCAKSFAKANDAAITYESGTGRGPVDFQFSTGYRNRHHVEIKLMSNGPFVKNPALQLAIYLKADGVKRGTILVVAYNDKEIEKFSEIVQKTANYAGQNNYVLDVITVDCRKKLSASKVRE